MHVEPNLQGELMQLFILYSHLGPVNVFKQAQAYELSVFKQLPPFKHGLELQLLIGMVQNWPVQLGRHVHVEPKAFSVHKPPF